MSTTATVGFAIYIAVLLAFVAIELVTKVDWPKLTQRVKRDK